MLSNNHIGEPQYITLILMPVSSLSSSTNLAKQQFVRPNNTKICAPKVRYATKVVPASKDHTSLSTPTSGQERVKLYNEVKIYLSKRSVRVSKVRRWCSRGHVGEMRGGLVRMERRGTSCGRMRRLSRGGDENVGCG